MILVLNEWIFHDLLGENGVEVQRETSRFLNEFYLSHDNLVLPKEPRWPQKAYRMMTQSDARLRVISKQFHTLILNSNRVIDVRTIAPQNVPEELCYRLPPEDEYLVTAYLSADADSLITTDQNLYVALADSAHVKCQLREEFLNDYRS